MGPKTQIPDPGLYRYGESGKGGEKMMLVFGSKKAPPELPQALGDAPFLLYTPPSQKRIP